MVVTVQTILIALLISAHVLPEGPSALLAHECHLHRLCQLMRSDCLSMAFCTIEPLATARCPDGDLRVEDVLAVSQSYAQSIVPWRRITSTMFNQIALISRTDHISPLLAIWRSS